MKSFTLKLFNIEWKIDVVGKTDDHYDEYFNNDGKLTYDGRCYYGTQHIVLRAELTTYRLQHTLIHELLHAILDATGHDNDENIIDAISTGLLDILMTNTDLLKHLSA